MKMIFNYDANKTHFYNKGFALSLVLKVKFFGTRKWPIKYNMRFQPVMNRMDGASVIEIRITMTSCIAVNLRQNIQIAFSYKLFLHC